jgi:hypothetical protein
MLCEIIHIEVHTESTRFFDVPAYEAPIIEAIWEEPVRAGVHKGFMITKKPTGRVEPRQLYEEINRFHRVYSGDNGTGRPAWRDIYPRDSDLVKAYTEAVDAGTALLAQQERDKVKATAKAEQKDEVGQTAQEAPARPRGKPGRKPGAKATAPTGSELVEV